MIQYMAIGSTPGFPGGPRAGFIYLPPSLFSVPPVATLVRPPDVPSRQASEHVPLPRSDNGSLNRSECRKTLMDLELRSRVATCDQGKSQPYSAISGSTPGAPETRLALAAVGAPDVVVPTISLVSKWLWDNAVEMTYYLPEVFIGGKSHDACLSCDRADRWATVKSRVETLVLVGAMSNSPAAVVGRHDLGPVSQRGVRRRGVLGGLDLGLAVRSCLAVGWQGNADTCKSGDGRDDKVVQLHGC